MNKLILIGINALRGFSGPVFNFLIALFAIKLFGKENWGTMINALLSIFLIVFLISWGNKEYLVRKYSKQPSKIFYAFYSNFLTRSLLLPLSLFLLLFFPLQIAFWSILLTILMHCYNALESLIIYNQKFGVQFIAEIIAFGSIISSLFFFENFSLELFLKLYCFAFILKLFIIIINLKIWKEHFSFKISLNEFTATFSFFMLGLSGWIVSKIDLYIVNFTMPKEQISEYQIAITAFLLIQSLSYFIILPFNKHFYRLPEKTIQKIKKIVASVSLPIVAISTFAVWFILEKIAQLNLPTSFYILGGLSCIPTYFFIVDIMIYYRNKKETSILKINFINAFINLILTFFLIQKMGIMGAIISVFINQCSILCFYKFKLIK
jgi:O-antigen/teichoic acid export membrane protein